MKDYSIPVTLNDKEYKLIFNINVMAVQNTASGTGVVRIDDVSPFTHNLGIKVYGKTEDDTNVIINKIKVYGKNLLDMNNFISRSLKLSDTTDADKVSWTNYDGYTEVVITDTLTVDAVISNTTPSEQYYLPAGTYSILQTSGNGNIYARIGMRSGADSEGGNAITFRGTAMTITEKRFITAASIQLKAGLEAGTYKIYWQIEAGDTATDFEAYKEPQSFTPDTAFDLVSGNTLSRDDFTANYPTTTVIVGSDTAVYPDVDVTYNQDLNSAIQEFRAALAAQA